LETTARFGAVQSDEQLIIALIGLHAQLTDDGNYAERVPLYTKDGRFIMGDNVSTGHDELTASFSASSAPERRGKHITANAVVEVDGDTASARSDFLFAHQGENGLAVTAAGRYRDTFARVDGQWRFTERRIIFLGS
jgi:3-phenylpropionate/cinnamic acid dioxygenase small subunit